jgi:group I intron endonuclease
MLVYKVLNKINHKIYIGITTDSLDKRIYMHEYKSKNNPPYIFQKALSKYGKDNFIWEIIDSASSIEELKQKEIFYIKHFNSHYKTGYGYNMTNGGDLVDHLTGENNPISKLSIDQVLLIHDLLKNTNLNHQEIVNKLNLPIGPAQIGVINTGENWNIDDVSYPIRNNSRNISSLGSKNPYAKLSEEDVKKIIIALETTNTPMPEIAKQYGVNRFTINKINQCVSWKQLHNYKKNIRKGV